MWIDFFHRKSVRIATAAAILTLTITGALTWRKAPRASGIPSSEKEVPRGEVHRVNGLLVRQGQTAPFTGIMVENHPRGSRKLEIEVRNGLLDGSSKGWYSNGQIEIDETFAADFSEGPRTRWYSNGVKRSVAHIRHGQLEGSYTEWHDNAQKAVVMTMEKGKPHGSVEAWHRSGALKSRSTLDHGKVVSQQFFDDPATAQAKAP